MLHQGHPNPSRTTTAANFHKCTPGTTTLGVAACLAVALLATTLPDARAAGKSNAPATNTPQPARKKLSVKHQRSPAEETKAERDRRLYRECQGRTNSGACLGYTRR